MTISSVFITQKRVVENEQNNLASISEAERQAIEFANNHLGSPLFSTTSTEVDSQGWPKTGHMKPISEIVKLLTIDGFNFNAQSGIIPYNRINYKKYYFNNGAASTSRSTATTNIECQILFQALKKSGYKKVEFTDKGIQYNKTN